MEDDSGNIMLVKTEVKPLVIDLFSLFAVYRTSVIRSEEVVHGILLPGVDLSGSEVRAALEDWNGRWYVQESGHGVEMTLVRTLRASTKPRHWLHAVLALLTAFTTTISGAFFAGYRPLELTWLQVGPIGFPYPAGIAMAELAPGLSFSIPLVAILLAHESGHYFLARRHGMDVSLPFFIPAPHWLNVIGTFGAFIKLRSVTINRAVLMDVGAAGPIASFFVSIPVLVLGLLWSVPAPVPASIAGSGFVVIFDQQPIWLGGSLLFSSLATLLGGGAPVLLLHPLALAGWLGLFVTALNLFPLAQLDGGHVLYALHRPAQRYVGIAFLVLLLVLGKLWWGWWLWAGLILVLGRGSIRHPAVFDPEYRVEGARRWIGWFCILIFVFTFVPVPIRI